jgi:hypothetical protein
VGELSTIRLDEKSRQLAESSQLIQNPHDMPLDIFGLQLPF